MPNTTTHTLPYPAATDTPDVPRDVGALAQRLDLRVLLTGVADVTTDAQGYATASLPPDTHRLVSVQMAQDSFAPVTIVLHPDGRRFRAFEGGNPMGAGTRVFAWVAVARTQVPK